MWQSPETLSPVLSLTGSGLSTVCYFGKSFSWLSCDELYFTEDPMAPLHLLCRGVGPALSRFVHTAQAVSDWGSAGQSKTVGHPTSISWLGCFRHNCLANKSNIWLSRAVPHLRLMMVIYKQSHNSSPIKVIKWFPFYHLYDKAGT